MWWWAMHYRRLPTYDAQGKDGHAKPPPAGVPWPAGLCRALLACLALVVSVMFVPVVHAVVAMARHSALVHTRMQAMGTQALELAAESRRHTHARRIQGGLPGCARAYARGATALGAPYALIASVTEVVQRGGGGVDSYAMGALKMRTALGNRTAAAGIDTILLVASVSATCVDAERGLGNGLHLALLAGWDAVCCVAPGILGMDGQEDLRMVPMRLRHDFNRFLAWGLHGYSLVMYMDSDAVVLRPDALVDAFPGVQGRMEGSNLFYACRKEWRMPYCNAGVFFARPSGQVLQGLLAVSRECYGPNARAMRTWHYTNSEGSTIFVPRGYTDMHRACWSDNGVLDAFFTRLSTWSDTRESAHHPLALTFNAVTHEVYKEFGARTVQDLDPVAVLHFTHPKPWRAWECDTWWGLEGWCDLWRRQPLVMGQQPSHRPALPLAPAAQ